jgi:hypothetical protein
MRVEDLRLPAGDFLRVVIRHAPVVVDAVRTLKAGETRRFPL